MKTILTAFSLVLLLTACSSTQIEDKERKQIELQDYKQQRSDLDKKIAALEQELASYSIEEEVVKVSVSEISQNQFEHFIEVVGLVEADFDVNVSPESAGAIQKIFVTEGQQVSEGQILAKLNTDALERGLDELTVQLEMAETNFNRQKNLWEQSIGSEMQFLQARTNMESLQKQIESLKAQINMSEIKSPVNGVVDIVFQ